MSHNITVDGGTSVRLKTAGKYCDRDIVVTAKGGGKIVLQSKTVTPSKTAQEVTADANYTALEKVTIEAIPSEYIVPSGTKTITENGTHDAKEYDSVSVNVPIPEGYIKPSGTKEITSNGVHDVKQNESVNVDVPIPDGYIVPIGTLEVTENGTYDVTDKASVTVTVAGGSTEPDPSVEYQRVEYIESTTGCKIVTDIFADNETGMELLAKYPVLADRVPMGSRFDSNATRFYVPYPLSANSFYYGFNTGSTRSTGAKANTLYRSAVNFLNHRCAIVMEDATNVSEFAYNFTETLATQTAPIGIFCYLRNVDGEYSSQSSRDMIFYSARISQGAEIIREYIPCYRKSDGEIGLYEKYTGAFLTNEGTGTFTKGDDIEW